MHIDGESQQHCAEESSGKALKTFLFLGPKLGGHPRETSTMQERRGERASARTSPARVFGASAVRFVSADGAAYEPPVVFLPSDPPAVVKQQVLMRHGCCSCIQCAIWYCIGGQGAPPCVPAHENNLQSGDACANRFRRHVINHRGSVWARGEAVRRYLPQQSARGAQRFNATR